MNTLNVLSTVLVFFIRVVRYEDLKHSKQQLQKVLKFLGLQMHQTMRDYLYAQNEKSNYDHWKKDMSFEDIMLGEHP